MSSRYDPNRVLPKMISIRTSPTEDSKMVQVHVLSEGGGEMLLVAITPNILKALGVPIDVRDPKSWNAEVQVPAEALKDVLKDLGGREKGLLN